MKSVLISIQPKWCEKIADGRKTIAVCKTIEVRKSAPKEVPFKVYIYETKGATETPWADEDGHLIFKGRGQVIGEFICDEVDKIVPDCQFGYLDYLALCDTCLSDKEIEEYGKGKTLYGWHISDLKIYDRPRELNEFLHRKRYDWWDYGRNTNKPQYEWENIERAPQSWMYVEEVQNVKNKG